MTEQNPVLWQNAMQDMASAMIAAASSRPAARHSLPYDPAAVLKSMSDFATGLSAQPEQLFAMQAQAAQEWGAFWTSVFIPKTGEPETAPRDRRFGDAQWNDDPWFRTIRDAYLLASRQLRDTVGKTDGVEGSSKAMVGFLLDQYLNAISPANFPMTNPEVARRTVETGGANLVSGFANLVRDVSAGKGIVKRRTSDAFTKGENIAATPGSVVFQNHLFQLIQYYPATPDVHAEPLLYVPPLVNKFYMIDLQPKSSFVRWLVEQGRTVFVISWIDPDDRHRDCSVEDYVLDGILEALGAVEKATGTKRTDLFSFCLGGTLVAIALAYLAEKKQAGRVGTATLIGSMVDFADMREWSAFVHEAHLDALDNHLEKRGFIDSVELQQLFSAVRANDLIWSSVVNHYLLDREAPPSDLLYWFEDGSRIPQAFLKSYNRALLFENRLAEPNGFEVGGVPIDLKAIKTPVTLIALKDDHVSAWDAVYSGARLFGGPVNFMLGGSGHNAGVINPPAANKHGYWRGTALPESAADWLDTAEKFSGSWWPVWDAWLTENGSGKHVPARKPGDGALAAIEPAPGSYAKITH